MIARHHNSVTVKCASMKYGKRNTIYSPLSLKKLKPVQLKVLCTPSLSYALSHSKFVIYHLVLYTFSDYVCNLNQHLI